MREEFPVFGVARQFGGQEGYSPAKRTLSWLTRGLLDELYLLLSECTQMVGCSMVWICAWNSMYLRLIALNRWCPCGKNGEILLGAITYQFAGHLR